MTAPFYLDPSRSVIAPYLCEYGGCYVINTEPLLEFARGTGGQDVEWEELGSYTFKIVVDEDHLGLIRVSGRRLFFFIRRDR